MSLDLNNTQLYTRGSKKQALSGMLRLKDGYLKSNSVEILKKKKHKQFRTKRRGKQNKQSVEKWYL